MIFKQILLLLAMAAPIGLMGQIKITVLSQNDRPLIGAVVSLNTNNYVCNKNGVAVIPNPATSTKQQVIINHLGFQSITVDTLLVANSNIIFHLKTALYQLNEIMVEEEHAKHEDSKNAVHLRKSELSKNQHISLSQSLNQIAGVQSINTGVGVSKPVIRGLSGNRIAVNQNGIKQEGQQWGQDHGLEIDVFDVEEVELIKGASALQYGSDATGGVVNILPFKLLDSSQTIANLNLIGHSNNSLFGGSINAATNVKGWTISGRFSYQNYADFKVAANTFNYNGFELPIYNNTLKNTAGIEQNARIGIGKKTHNYVFRLCLSQYHLIGGFFSGAVGIPTAYSLVDDGNKRDFDLPYQNVRHQKTTLNYIRHIGKSHLSIDLGLQQNQRAEHSFPDFHNLPITDQNATLGQFFKLTTLSANAHYDYILTEKITQVIGASFQRQINQIDGFDYLLPNFTLNRVGAFWLSEYKKENGAKINAALRFDHGQNLVQQNVRYIYNSQNEIIDSLNFKAIDQTFSNWSASIGFFNRPNNKTVIKGNLSKSFRIPYPNETSSNGIHHGTFRHEQGTTNLNHETGYHIDLTYQFIKSRVNIEAAGFASVYNGFIYLAPSAKFSYLPEAGQIYQYEQNNAALIGAVLSYTLDLTEKWELNQTAEFIYSQNLNTGLALPFTPPFMLNSTVEWHTHYNEHKSTIRVLANAEFAAAQNLVDRNEKTTPGYLIGNLLIGGNFFIGPKNISWNMRLNNMANSPYLNHLSRYRILNLPEQGRNLIMSVEIPIR
ncbi:MAG: TonB-dependent receptor plug domain-containing protein [Bacteroidia bacterium]